MTIREATPLDGFRLTSGNLYRLRIPTHANLFGLGQETREEFTFPSYLPTVGVVTGVGIAAAGFYYRNSLAGAIALGAGSSIVGASLLLLMRQIFP